MMPITPSGTRTREIFRPLGRSQLARTSPTGSGRSAICSSPAAMASIRLASSFRRSISDAAMFRASAAAISSALAANRLSVWSLRAAAAACSALFLRSLSACPSSCTAARARLPSSAIWQAISFVSIPVATLIIPAPQTCLPPRPYRPGGSFHPGHGSPEYPLYHGFFARQCG